MEQDFLMFAATPHELVVLGNHGHSLRRVWRSGSIGSSNYVFYKGSLTQQSY